MRKERKNGMVCYGMVRRDLLRGDFYEAVSIQPQQQNKDMSDILTVGLGERTYPIHIKQKGLLEKVGVSLAGMNIAKRFCIISDSTVAPLFCNCLEESFFQASLPVERLRFSAGEQSKNLATVEELCRGLARLGFDRRDALVALGGGVTGDITGFVAAIYMRGIPFVQVPTTLLAQVDSSVGGKTGVDIPEGKNLIGAFYQPKAVYIDTDVLRYLPDSELANGLAEVIKYSVIQDLDFFSFLTDNRAEIMGRSPDILAAVIRTCCAIKAQVVAADEKETDHRRILNFGHTIGHAVEAVSEYKLAHGQAVAMGMVAACRLAVQRGMFAVADAENVAQLIKGCGLPTSIPVGFDREKMVALLRTDKKTVAGRPVFILPTAIGKVSVVDDISDAEIMAVLN